MTVNPIKRKYTDNYYEKDKYIQQLKSIYFNDFSLGLYNKIEEVINKHQDDYDNILQILDNEYALSNYLSKHDPIIEVYHSCNFINDMKPFQKALVGIILLETYECKNNELMKNVQTIRTKLSNIC